jgi:hypothetical protein
MENSAILTGCNRLTCKGDGTFFQHSDQVNPTNSYDDDGIFQNQRKFPTVSRSHAKEFPTIFRQLSDGEKAIKITKFESLLALSYSSSVLC